MARTTSKKDKPAEAKPADTQPAEAQGVGIKELAQAVGKSPKSTRAAIRRHLNGPQVGQGGRYRWDSENDPQFKELVAVMTKTSGGEDE